MNISFCRSDMFNVFRRENIFGDNSIYKTIIYSMKFAFLGGGEKLLRLEYALNSHL